MRRLLQVSMVAAVAAATMAALPVGATTQGVDGQVASDGFQAADAQRRRRLLQANPTGSLPPALRSSAASTGAPEQVAAPPTLPSTSVANSRAPSNFERSACPIEFPPELTVDCGVLTAPENRRKDNGRTVRLPVAIIRAPTTTPKPDPIVYVTGGPSFNEIDPFSAGFFSGLPFAQDRDFILYNQRGVGYAEPRLGCPEFDALRAATFPQGPTPGQWLDAVDACHDRLISEGVDLRAYNSAEDAADLRDLRRALGYKQWNLYVLSAGGVIGLTAMRLYPQGIRSVILDSALGNRFKLRGPDIWGGQNRALEMVFAGCAADTACEAAYPNLRARFYERVHALRADPVVVDLPVEGGGTFALTVDGDLVLADASSCASDGPFCAPSLPGALDAVADGDIASVYVGDPIAPDPPLDPFLAEGKSGVARCHDQIAFEPDSELRRAARELPEFRAHLLTLRFIYIPTLTKQACKLWRAGRAEPAQNRPVVSAIPTLVLTARWDGIVWPPEGQEIASHLRNSFYFEFPGIAHGTLFASLDGIDCPATIAAAFVDVPRTSPDAGCIATMPDLSFTPP
jgi:pimeloyl-ACP methyl ester carboxylesterase